MRPTTTRQACAFQRGYQAAKAGKPASVNPHKKGTADYGWWDKGFDAAVSGASTSA